MFIVKVYVTRERKRSAPKRSLLMRVKVDAQERDKLIQTYNEAPFQVAIIKAYKGAV